MPTLYRLMSGRRSPVIDPRRSTLRPWYMTHRRAGGFIRGAIFCGTCTPCNCNANIHCIRTVFSGLTSCDGVCYDFPTMGPSGSSFKLIDALPSSVDTYCSFDELQSSEDVCVYAGSVFGSWDVEQYTGSGCGGTLVDTQTATAINILIISNGATVVSVRAWIEASFFVFGLGSVTIQLRLFHDDDIFNFNASQSNEITSCIVLTSLGPSLAAGSHSGTIVASIEQSGIECNLCESCADVDEPPCNGNCAPCTPDTIRAVVSGITTTTTCVISGTNSFQLSGSTDPNRTIDLARASFDSCTWEATVACDRTLTRHSNALCSSATNTFNIVTIKYTLIRTSSTNWTWEVAGYDDEDPEVKRVSFAGATSVSCALDPMNITATASVCDAVSTASHPTRTACGNTSTNAGIFGSDGSTTFTVCP